MKPPLFICGPTASGKSTLALALAEALEGEVVNGDAFQLYKGLPIITAAPSREEMGDIPHHLYGVLSPSETCDAMRYREIALPVIADIQSRGRRPIVCGGSGLYLKFLTHGPSPLPSGDPELRATLEPESFDSLVARLRELDPVEAERTDLANRRFVTRALEICLLSGQPCSSLRDRWETKQSEINDSLLGLFIQRERDDLHQRINRRTRQMLDSGAVEEVRLISDLGKAGEGLSKAIGVPQIQAFLSGQIDRETCETDIATATRQYAKRQETWFRREKWLQRVDWKTDSPAPLQAALDALSNRL